MGLFDDLIPQQNGRAVKGDRLDRKPTLFDDIPIEANPRPQAMTLEQQRAVALARARRRREGEAQRPRKPTLYDDILPSARKPNLFDDLIPQARRPNLFDDLPMEGSQQAEPSLLGSIATGAVSGLTLGFDDEIAAGLNTGFGFAGDYSQELERQRAIQGQYRDANPWAAGAGEIGGALATAPLAGGLNVMRGTGLAAGVANSALTGAGEAFLDALHADWQEHGADAIARVRQDRPQDYLKVVASTLPKDLHVSDGRTNDPRQLSDEDLTAVILNGKGQ